MNTPTNNTVDTTETTEQTPELSGNITSIVENTNEQLEQTMKIDLIKDNTIKIQDIANFLGLKPEKVTLPNGKEIMTTTYLPEHLPLVFSAVSKNYQNLWLGKNDHVVIDWACPGWLLTCITHALHPVSVSVSYPQWVNAKTLPLTWTEIEWEWSWENLEYKITENEEYNIVEFVMTDTQINVEKTLANITSPKLPNNKPVIITWRWPISISTTLAESYSHSVPFVACFQPWTGNVVAISHNAENPLWKIVS